MTGLRERHPENGDNFLEGKLLIAMPGMADPHFEKSVIFMCAHSSEGAMGIMINKAVAGLSFHDLMEKLELNVNPDTPNFPILYGGPVETGRGFVLHSGDYEGSEATLPVSEDISLTATLDILRAMADGRGPQHAIFALGYAGWTAGQIEDEIRRNGWIHCDCDPELLFNGELDSKWSAALRKLGIDVSGLSLHAGHA
ncbi:MAG TPA: YqgE/AlgH family protein [Rhizomicrobium sp.]|jgi:putative transcriptional regulator|nr:YqgE/AlgH family protein [Rhizomicrobium sp.]